MYIYIKNTKPQIIPQDNIIINTQTRKKTRTLVSSVRIRILPDEVEHWFQAAEDSIEEAFPRFCVLVCCDLRGCDNHSLLHDIFYFSKICKKMFKI